MSNKPVGKINSNDILESIIGKPKSYDFGNGIGTDAADFNSIMNTSFDLIDQSGTGMVGRANDQKREMDKLNQQAQQVTQENMKDSIKIGMANLLAKSYNMLTQSHLSLAKEAIEVAKTSV